MGVSPNGVSPNGGSPNGGSPNDPSVQMGVVQKELVQSGLVQITPQYFQMMLVHMGVVQIMKNFIGSEVKTTCSCCRNVKR